MKRPAKIVIGKVDPRVAANPKAQRYLSEEFTEQVVAAFSAAKDAAIRRQRPAAIPSPKAKA